MLAAGRFRLRSALLTEAAFEDLRDVLGEAAVYVAREETIKGVVGFNFHRGCIGVGERGTEPSLEALLGRLAPGPSLLVILEGMTNPDNVGGVFRNALAFGVGAVVLSPGCADPLYRKAIRVSMGGALQTPFAHAAEWPAALDQVRTAGFTVVALTPRADAVDIAEFGAGRAIPERVALLLGAEGQGLSEAARTAADVAVRVAMAPGVDSLNVATVSGIALHRLGGAARRPGAT